MRSNDFVYRSVLSFILFLASIVIIGQESKDYVPHVGQAGKDVIWVPTPESLVDKMLEIAKVTPQDYVVDLGSGDGRTVIAAAKLKAKATGIEYNPDMVELSTHRAKEAGVSDKANFLKADLFEYDLSNATVITMFLLPEINLKLRPKLLELKPGTRIVSNTFTMGEWEPDLEAVIDESSSWNTALLWIVPAKIDGTWKMGKSELILNQEFQKFWGTLKNENKSTSVSDGKINGSNITFKVGNTVYTGKVSNDKITGTYQDGSVKADWTATKTK
ncbi:MAG TPA: class I SAM-dependent methyltransferase [Bacteroidales bacterium]|nr:class I SAM-dependent methyltransferase [Bacteroidales bacterium]